MPKEWEQDTTGRRWEAAPVGTLPSSMTSAVMGTWVNPGERIDWHWCHTPQGSYVSGYTIVTMGELGESMKEEVCPLGGCIPPVRVKIENKVSGWDGEFGVIDHGIGENGAFSIRLDSGMRTAFSGNELQASDRNPPVV